jgi:hypothetical protein
MRINPYADYEVRYWTQKLGISAETLRRLVDKVGPLAKDVEAHLSQDLRNTDRKTG